MYVFTIEFLSGKKNAKIAQSLKMSSKVDKVVSEKKFCITFLPHSGNPKAQRKVHFEVQLKVQYRLATPSRPKPQKGPWATSENL